MANEKKLSDYTEEELKAMPEAELDKLLDQHESEQDGNGDGDDDGAPGSDKRRTLYGRFSEVNRKLKAIEAENRALRDEREAERKALLERVTGGGKNDADEDPEPQRPDVGDVADLKAKRRKALREGDFDQVEELESKLDAVESRLSKWQSDREAWRDRQREKAVSEAVGKATERVRSETRAEAMAERMAEVAEEIFEQYPFFDEDSDLHDPDAVAAFVSERNRLIKEGKTPIAAMRAAAKAKGPRFAKINGLGGDGDGDEGEDRGTDRGGKQQTREERLRAAVARAAGTRQPPTTGKGGSGDGKGGGVKKNVADMTDDEIRALADEDVSKVVNKKRA